MNITLKTMVATAILSACAIISYAQSGNHVSSGAEATNFGVIDLATPAGTTWSTFRGAAPGYFSAVGTASYTSPGDAYNVDGYVKHYATSADQEFNFPVGTGTDYRSLAIRGNIPASSEIAVAWIVGDPTTTIDPTGAGDGLHPISQTDGTLNAVSTAGQWDWQDLSNDAAGITVTVSIPDLTTFALANYLRLVGWNGTEWVNLSGTSGASGNTENSTLIGTMISGISAIGIGAMFPDLTPRITVNPNNIIGSQTIEITVQINELSNVNTDGTLITLYVDKSADFSNFNFNSAQTLNIANESVQNSLFNIDAISNPDYYVITTNVVFKNSNKRVAFKVDFNPKDAIGESPVNVFLKNGSGGENKFSNNSDFTSITFSF